MNFHRRDFLTAAAVTGAAVSGPKPSAQSAESTNADSVSQPLRNARMLGDRLVKWQSPYGSMDIEKCPLRSPAGTPTIALVQGIGPQVRALYELHAATGDEKYKQAADRYAIFVLSTIHDPPTPLTNMITIDGKKLNTNASAWVYGKSLSPCFEWFTANNPNEDMLNLKAHAIYKWLQRHRRAGSYFGVGYPIGKYEDAQFSCDLGEVGTGLVGFYKRTKHPPALDDAFGLAKYFLTEYEPGTANGVWSSKLNTWLVGPWPGGGAEHFTTQVYNESAWGWSCLVVGEFLLELRQFVDDDATRSSIDSKCVAALQWCLDECQFDDGAHGMFGRDDKWVGQTAAAILLYAKLAELDLLPDKVRETYHPKIMRSWQWMLNYTAKDTYPKHGYIKVTGSTTTKPLENLLWMMSWTIEALLHGERLFAAAK
jgi:hypothetical protein